MRVGRGRRGARRARAGGGGRAGALRGAAVARAAQRHRRGAGAGAGLPRACGAPRVGVGGERGFRAGGRGAGAHQRAVLAGAAVAGAGEPGVGPGAGPGGKGHQAKAQVQQARGTVDERAEAVGQTVVRAPISGRVGQRNAEVGMRADGQTPLFTIGDLSKVQVEVPVTQEMLGRIAEGQPARITASGLRDSTIGAEVSRISPFIESGTYSAEAEIDVNNENGPLRPGMFVNVDVSYGETRKATLVPVSALHEHPETGRRGVYVAPSLGSELQPRPVESSAEGSGSASGSAAG
ncbi:MAG: hypothetical protein BRD29_04085, partial [Bacteroidetes bacterium QH_2_67_10]